MEKEQRYTLPLKHGGRQVDVLEGLLTASFLRSLLDLRPGDFQSVLALARGKKDGVSSEDARRLKGGLFIAENGSVSPIVRDVLLSGYLETSDGPQVLNPFKLGGERDKLIVERVEQQILRLAEESFKEATFRIP